MRKKITYYVRSEDIPLTGRLFNLLNAISILYILISVFTSSDSTYVLLGFFVGAVALLIRTNQTGRYKLGSNIFVIGVGFVFFPFLFILNDGVKGGIPFFMVFGAIMICLLLQGKNCVIVLSLYLAATSCCIAYDYYHTENNLSIMLPFTSELSRYFYIALSLIICSVMSGIIIRYQNTLYIREKRKAELASQAKGDFLSHMSHEIRTPMSAIIGLTAIAKSAATPEDKDHALKRIGDASQQLLGIINDILDMSKIEAGKMELSPVTFTFEQMLQKVMNVIAFRAEEKRISLSFDIDHAIPPVIKADDQRLSQVLTNLLSNAVKFTPEGGSIQVNAKFVEEKKNICTIQIEVSDTGIGISEEQQARLFTSYGQAEQSTSRKFGGTGLGLAISKRIVELMNGTIWISSEVGRGSTFAFTIQSERSREASPAAEEQSAPLGNFRGRRALLAEDVAINREIVLALLEPTLLDIDCVENGEEAVKRFAEAPERYDIIFMDVQMPKMDGYEATRQIRAMSSDAARNIPIIAMTANVFREDVDKCLQAGMNDHVGKPLDLDDVMKKLHAHVTSN